MANIDVRITAIQQHVNDLLERVTKGEVLSREEVLAIQECRAAFDKLKQVDTYREIMRGTKLKELTDKWSQ